MRLLLALGLALCCRVSETNVLKVNRSKGWVRNNDPYEVKSGLRVGDELEAKFTGNNHYYISFTDRILGRTILEIRFGQTSTSIQHTSSCEGYGPSFKIFRDSVTTGDMQSLEMKLRKDGLTFSLDGGEDQVLKLEGCDFPWESIKFLEFGGHCKKTYGNWRALLLERS